MTKIQISSDNEKTESILKKLVNQILEAGGSINNSIVLKCNQGELAVHAQSPSTVPENIFAFPPECLIPIDQFKLRLDKNQLIISSHVPDLGSTRLSLLETMIDLFNQTGKVDIHKATSPWMLNTEFPDLLREIAGGRSEQVYLELVDSLNGNTDNEELIIKSLLKTRVIGFTSDAASQTRTQMLMPIIDLINHHPMAPTYTNYVDQYNNSKLTIKGFCTNPSDGECFVRYGYYDALDLYLTYGYVDTQTFFVRSIPMEVKLPKIGTIKIHSTTHHPTRKNLPPQIADLDVYLPNISIDHQKKLTEAAYLLIPTKNAPYALRRVFSIILQNIDSSLDQTYMKQLIEIAEAQVLKQNRSFYENLLQLIHSTEANENSEVRQQLDLAASMARQQLTRLDDYPFAPT